MYRWLSSALYSKEGAILGGHIANKEESGWHPIIQNSIMYNLYIDVCK